MPAKPSQSHAPACPRWRKKNEVVLFNLGPRRLYHLLRGSTYQLAQPSVSGLMQTGVGILFWIGGMIFFGVSHLITER
jgi:hypothetical protein